MTDVDVNVARPAVRYKAANAHHPYTAPPSESWHKATGREKAKKRERKKVVKYSTNRNSRSLKNKRQPLKKRAQPGDVQFAASQGESQILFFQKKYFAFTPLQKELKNVGGGPTLKWRAWTWRVALFAFDQRRVVGKCTTAAIPSLAVLLGDRWRWQRNQSVVVLVMRRSRRSRHGQSLLPDAGGFQLFVHALALVLQISYLASELLQINYLRIQRC